MRLPLFLLLPFLIALQGCSAVPTAPAAPPATEAPATPPPPIEIPSPQAPAVDSSTPAETPVAAESVTSQEEPAPQTGHPGAVNMPTSYTVSNGETLWSIAARPEIYSDPLLWMLLYQANRDQIMDPRHIYRGQTLRVPRNISEREQDELREAAQKSSIFPVGETPSSTR